MAVMSRAKYTGLRSRQVRFYLEPQHFVPAWPGQDKESMCFIQESTACRDPETARPPPRQEGPLTKAINRRLLHATSCRNMGFPQVQLVRAHTIGKIQQIKDLELKELRLQSGKAPTCDFARTWGSQPSERRSLRRLVTPTEAGSPVVRVARLRPMMLRRNLNRPPGQGFEEEI